MLGWLCARSMRQHGSLVPQKPQQAVVSTQTFLCLPAQLHVRRGSLLLTAGWACARD